MAKPEDGVERGIPIPPPKSLDGHSVTTDLRRMKVGDSVVRPVEKRDSYYITSRRLKVKVVTRSLGDGTMRVWRVK